MFILLGFLLTITFGLLVSFMVAPKLKAVERLGVSYVLGLGFQTLFMFFSYLFGIKFTLINSFFILFIAIIPFLIAFWKKIIPFLVDLKSDVSMHGFSKTEKIIVYIIMFFITFSLIYTLYWPVSAWDSLVLYDWRAKLFYETGTMVEGIRSGDFFGVPLLTSLAHTWEYLLGGKYPEFIYSLFLFAFAAMFYGSLVKFTSRLVSIFATLIVVTLPDIFTHSTFSYTNFPYTVYFVMSTIYLYISIVKKEKGYFVLSAILLGLSTWARSTEPFWLVNLFILIIYFLYKKKFWQPVAFSIIFFLIRQPWVIFENNHLSYDTTVTSKIYQGFSVLVGKINIAQIFLVINFLKNNFLMPLLTFFLLFVIFFVRGLSSNYKKRNFLFESFIFGYVALTMVGTYIFSMTFHDWQIGGSLGRMTMFFPPLIIFYIASSRVLRDIF